jgi:hypothetical protein
MLGTTEPVKTNDLQHVLQQALYNTNKHEVGTPLGN